MKKLIEFDSKEIFDMVMQSKDICYKLDLRYTEDVYYDINEYMSILNEDNVIKDWQFGVNSLSYMEIKEERRYRFMLNVEELNNCFGLPIKIEMKLNQCKKLQDTNLFNYHVDKLAEMVECMIKQEIIDCEDFSSAIYNGNPTQDDIEKYDIQDMVDRYVDDNEDVLYVDDEGNLVEMNVLK